MPKQRSDPKGQGHVLIFFVFSSTTYTEQVEAAENDRMRLQHSLGLSVRPGFQIPLEVLQKTRRKRAENAAQLAIFKQIEDEIWNKKKRQKQQKAHTSTSAHAAKRQVGNTIMVINSMNKLCRPKMCLREREERERDLQYIIIHVTCI